MSSNDTLTLILSCLALLVSVISAVISYRQARTESRDQLNTLIQEIVRTQSERHDSMTMTKIAFLARQAAAIIEEEPAILTDVDYSVTANAFAFLGDSPRAHDYWQKSVTHSPTEFYRVVNQRGFASFLLWQGKHEQGRKLYQEALGVFDSVSDSNKYINGFTYQMWFNSEAWSFSLASAKAQACYNEAKNLFGSISSPHMRGKALQDLEMARNFHLSPNAGSNAPIAANAPAAAT